ncbi:MAG: RNA-binding domain-containing protein [Methanobacteriaceae archaeon]|nr:RNA-binding domain-containing protein [Methanobacteriaceae archaeon]
MISKFQAITHVHKTEDIKKVIESLNHIFMYDNIVIEESEILISGSRKGLEDLKESLKKRKVRETARKILEKGIHKNHINFKLSKQAAFAGTPVLLDQELSALGEIEVKVETDDIEGFIDWLAPSQV